MRRGRDWMQRFADGMDLNGTPLPAVPLVEMSGDSRVLIEHHAGVTQYGKECIRVKVAYGCVEICGYNLVLSRMTPAQLVIRGRIHSVSLQRENV